MVSVYARCRPTDTGSMHDRRNRDRAVYRLYIGRISV